MLKRLWLDEKSKIKGGMNGASVNHVQKHLNFFSATDSSGLTWTYFSNFYKTLQQQLSDKFDEILLSTLF